MSLRVSLVGWCVFLFSLILACSFLSCWVFETKHFTTYERSESIWRLNCILRRRLYLWFDWYECRGERCFVVYHWPPSVSLISTLAHIRFNPKLLFWSRSFSILNSFAHFLVFSSPQILSLTITNDFVFFTTMATQKPGKKIT